MNAHNDATQKANARTSGAPAEATLRLAEILEAYLADLDAGRSPDRARLLAEHPDLAAPLEEALAGLEFLHRARHAPPTEPLQLGDFRILREIGRGGMGVVYEAEQISLKRRVALKVLRYGPVADEVAMHRFQREAETVGRLHHTNIVPIFAVGAEAGVRYYAMQFIEGRDLAELANAARENGDPPDFRRLTDWGLQAADALAHAHRRGVIHRDIKPSNLILDEEGRIWLTDFGLARRSDDVSLSLTGALLGTPRYMSPEQAAAARRPVDHRTDLYSLGATLYELVTGRPIFEATTAHEVISQILNTEPTPPRQFTPSLPRDLETILLKCLAKEPERRYATAQALADDLRAFADGRPILARRPRLAERATRWVRKHRRLATAAAVSATATLAILAAIVLGWRSYQDAHRGQLRLSTPDPNLLGEVLASDGHPMGPLFAIPNETPMTLPAGTWGLRVSSAGALSETWPVDIPARRLVELAVHLPSRGPWSAREIAPPHSLELVRLRDRTDLLVLLPMESGDDATRQPVRLRLLDGGTLKPLWTQDFRFDATTLPPEGDLAEWQSLAVYWAAAPVFAGTGIADRVRDLDHDGVGDLVLVARNTPSLVAISGASGQLLWWHRARPLIPPGAEQVAKWQSQVGGGFVVADAIAADDVDQDGVPDYLACFQSTTTVYTATTGAVVRVPAQSWIGTISGRTGLGLWRQPLDEDWSEYLSSSTGTERGSRLGTPRFLRLDHRPLVIAAERGRVRVWDAEDGRPAWGPLKTSVDLDRLPDFVDLDHDERLEALTVRRLPDPECGFELLALDLPGGELRWRRTVLHLPSYQPHQLAPVITNLFAAFDLEGDGRLAIAACASSRSPEGGWRFGVELLDGPTGRLRWEKTLYRGEGPQSTPELSRLVAAPDLDRDGRRDLIALIPSYDREKARFGLLTLALSGSDGSEIWRQHHPEIAGARGVTWWHPGGDGQPLLVVTTARFAGSRDATVVLNTGSGRIAHTLLDVREVRVGDFDGDGIPDLFYPLLSAGNLRWTAAQGRPPNAWRHLGAWTAGPDVDGDQRADFFGAANEAVQARSGSAEGHRLWQTPAALASPPAIHVPLGSSPLPQRHTGDTPSMIFAEVTVERTDASRTRRSRRGLAAFNARDGGHLWTADDLALDGGTLGGTTLGWSYEYPHILTTDLDSDGRTDVLAITMDPQAAGLQLSVISGRDGRTQWRTPVVEGALAGDPSPAGWPLADFDRDQVRDVALILPPARDPQGDRRFRVNVLNGSTGQPFWPADFPLAREALQVAWPEAALGDLDHDQVPEVLVVRHHGFRPDGTGYDAELVVLDGRSGQVRWTWSWRTGFPEIWPPLVLPGPAPGGPRVALGFSSSGSAAIAVLDSRGRLLEQVPVGLLRNSMRLGAFAWRAADLNGDGAAELVYLDAGNLTIAAGPDLNLRTSWPLPPGTEGVRVLGVVPSREPPFTSLAVWAGRAIYGLDGSTGLPRWRCPAPTEPIVGQAAGAAVRLIPSAEPWGLPLLQFPFPIAPSDETEIDQAWPTTPDGRYLPPAPEFTTP